MATLHAKTKGGCWPLAIVRATDAGDGEADAAIEVKLDSVLGLLSGSWLNAGCSSRLGAIAWLLGAGFSGRLLLIQRLGMFAVGCRWVWV
jgi:hypothetical protein